MTNFGFQGHFGPIFGLGVTLSLFLVSGSLWATFGFRDHFRSIFGQGVTFGPSLSQPVPTIKKGSGCGLSPAPLSQDLRKRARAGRRLEPFRTLLITLLSVSV